MINKVIKFISSMQFMSILILIFAFSIGSKGLTEEKYSLHIPFTFSPGRAISIEDRKFEYSIGDFEYPMPLGSYEINIQVNFPDGDVNQDGSQNVQDIILMINYIIGTNDLYESQIQIADLNNDGSVDVMDIILLVNIIINP